MPKRLLTAFFVLAAVIPASGGQWESLGLSASQVLSIAADPDNQLNICAGTAAGLYYSTDGGQAWEPRIALDGVFTFLSYTPQSNDTVICIKSGTSGADGLYISANDGNVWSQTGHFTEARRVGFDPVDRGFIYVCFPDGILKSQDYGLSNSEANEGLPALSILDVKGDGRNGLEAYAVGEAFVANTTNFGNHWTQLNGLFGLEDYNPSRLEHDPFGSETLYVSCYAYFARSFNGGTTWSYTLMPATGNQPIACDPAVPGELYVGSVDGGGVMRSTDAGATFQFFNDNLGNLNVHSLAFDAGGNLLAGTEGGIYLYDFSSAIDDNGQDLPRGIKLGGNYPNPFNSQTMIELVADAPQVVSLDICDITGRAVVNIYAGLVEGRYLLRWDGTSEAGRAAASGVYLWRLQTDDGATYRRMLLLK